MKEGQKQSGNPNAKQTSDEEMEKNLMGMFENLAKQLENFDDDDDKDVDEESIKEAEKMM
jgi:hypothetical protein